MNDRELLELAAEAAGLPYIKPTEGYSGALGLEVGDNPMRTQNWNPLSDDGDALRLAAKLYLWEAVRLAHRYMSSDVDIYAATRRAIVLAAAEIARIARAQRSA